MRRAVPGLVSLLACGLCSGCIMDAIILSHPDLAKRLFKNSPPAFSADEPDAADTREALQAAYNPDSVLAALSRTPRGSLVALVDDGNHRYTGTLLQADAEHVELMNCVSRETVAAPGRGQQCKTSHVPFESLSTSSLTHLIVIGPPSQDVGFSELGDDHSDVTVDALVFRSGRRQSISGRATDGSEAGSARTAQAGSVPQ